MIRRYPVEILAPAVFGAIVIACLVEVQHEQINSVRPYHRLPGCSRGADRFHFYRGWEVSDGN